MSVLAVDAVADCSMMIRRLRRSAPHLAAVLDIVEAGKLSLAIVFREPPAVTLGAVQKPLLVLVADDDDAPSGPQRFQQADLRDAFQQARGAIIHTGAAAASAYAQAAVRAHRNGVAVLVESTPAHAQAWQEAISAMAPGPRVDALPPKPGI
jgi:hypothetical protein